MICLGLKRGWPILLGVLLFTLTIATGSAQTEYRPKLAVPEAMQPFLKVPRARRGRVPARAPGEGARGAAA